MKALNELALYGTSNDTIWRVAAFLGASGILIFLVNGLLRKVLGVERKKWFSRSQNYVNERYEKVDMYFRWSGAAVLFITVFAFYRHGLWLPLTVMAVFTVIQELYTAYMEKKHADHPNAYLFTLLTLPTSLVVLFVCAYIILPEFSDLLFYEFE